jgi:hypothetical protein
LENFNEKLLMLTNIIENKTKYVGIYSYITEMIKNTNHAKIIKTLNNKLDVTEINNLINDEDTKKRAMPASYGKTLYSNRIDTDNILNADNRSRT